MYRYIYIYIYTCVQTLHTCRCSPKLKTLNTLRLSRASSQDPHRACIQTLTGLGLKLRSTGGSQCLEKAWPPSDALPQSKTGLPQPP